MVEYIAGQIVECCAPHLMPTNIEMSSQLGRVELDLLCL